MAATWLPSTGTDEVSHLGCDLSNSSSALRPALTAVVSMLSGSHVCD